MSNTLDSNSWYTLSYGDSSASRNAVLAFNINNSGSGAIAGNPLNATTNQNAYQWQVLPLGSPDTYVIRSRSLGNQWSMGTFWQPVSGLPGMDTRVRSENYRSPDVTRKSAQWIIQTTGDGTGLYYVSTVQNGTGFHLDSSNGGTIYLRDASAGSYTNGMKWAFSSVGAIDDQQWSYTPTATSAQATSIPTTTTGSIPASNTASPTPASTSAPSQRSQSPISNGARIAIITSIVVASLAFTLLLLGIIGVYCHRRRKRRKQKYSPKSGYDAKMELEGRQIYPSRTQQDSTAPPFQGTSHSLPTQQKPSSYEKARGPIGEKHPALREWENATELPADSNVTVPVASRSEDDNKF